MSGDNHSHDKGLEHDLKILALRQDRRQILQWMAGATFLAGCGVGAEGLGIGADGTGTDELANCSTIPEETQGPYPGDGSNGPNALSLSGIVRSDIRSSIGSATGTAAGIVLTLKLTLVSSTQSCNPLSGYAIYVWHCDRDGKYSMYDLPAQNYLRGVQATDSNGVATFTTIFPGCYAGRVPHIHFEIYPSLAKATSAANKIKTSQLAFPLDVCKTAYAATGYATSATNLTKVSFATDMVFKDGTSLQMASITGSNTAGYIATLPVAIAA
ncbi:intradiol ring-cleavage dioxygenase [Vitiosangium sp. GDMCC 1.1324]|uniref:intradiol ring-cleavage dioxygenase n=1 Tax=Vitiosangium sp. (strain GDMCC 1.1324) TaxID=2138576 RepID=UPI000D374120|nr:intradiol ring-cleavage dioxygenase [Vitiosangium sp. GDMCC 1.1324]PTL79263.1 dioxygenase [Vitiosangium sp. GDMCC 1.1324]